ncbi:hypothetical protein PG999_003777 [Apiospora kogelbergensis]|uniref:NAD(P)-binding domain-containing protein n=1 Tax=Apiospora kogelbergensis TaxID=1337665 RepID=A0AAW0R4H3_9PEZI
MGGTGHIGGAVLDLLVRSHPDLEVLVLVRDQLKTDKVKSKYPQVQCVVGDFTSLDLIEATCRATDIVINAGPDITHDKAFEAALRGLQEGREGGDKKKPYFIHTSGAYLICDLRQPGGVKEDKVWDDIEDNEQLVSMPDKAVHRATDKIVLSASPQVNVAIVSPGGVTGISPSVAHPLPITTPALFQCVRVFDSTFVIGQGENAVAMIHVHDLARMYMVLVNDALATLTGSKNSAISPSEPPFPLWGERAYYFGSAVDSLYRRDWMEGLAPLLVKHGVVSSSEVKSVSTAEVARRVLFGDDYDPDAPPPPLDSWATHIANGFGANIRARASKMRKLGWEPEYVSFADGMDKIITSYLELEKEGMNSSETTGTNSK